MTNNTHGSTTMAEQLAKIQPAIRQRYSSVVAISQVALLLVDNDRDSAFNKSRTQILRWLDGRAGRPLPSSALKGESFALEELGAQRLEAVALEAPRYWASRLDDADKAVPQRTWVTEASIAIAPESGILVGARLVCASRGPNEPFIRSVPGFIRQIVEKDVALLDGHRIQIKPRVVNGHAEVEALVQLIKSPERRSDVIVFSLPEKSDDPMETAAPADIVCQRTLGAAHTVVLTGRASFLLSDAIGKEFSVFQQAVRTYRPGFNENSSQRYEHPLAFAQRIAQWPDGGPEAYARFLVSTSLAHSVAVPDSERVVPSFATVRRFAAQQRLVAAKDHDSSVVDLLQLAEEESDNLRKELQEQENTYASLLRSAEAERDGAVRIADAERARAIALRARIESLESAIKQEGGAAEVSIPGDLSDFEQWCDRHLAGVVELHTRAYQGIKKSQYQDDAFLYRALLMLRDYYVPMRRLGGAERKKRYEEQCAALGVEEAPSLSSERYGEAGDTYFVQYEGSRRVLDRHLKRGASRDARRCFRLYFFWDDDTQQVVVGWLPSHLETRAT